MSASNVNNPAVVADVAMDDASAAPVSANGHDAQHAGPIDEKQLPQAVVSGEKNHEDMDVDAINQDGGVPIDEKHATQAVVSGDTDIEMQKDQPATNGDDELTDASDHEDGDEAEPHMSDIPVNAAMPDDPDAHPVFKPDIFDDQDPIGPLEERNKETALELLPDWTERQQGSRVAFTAHVVSRAKGLLCFRDPEKTPEYDVRMKFSFLPRMYHHSLCEIKLITDTVEDPNDTSIDTEHVASLFLSRHNTRRLNAQLISNLKVLEALHPDLPTVYKKDPGLASAFGRDALWVVTFEYDPEHTHATNVYPARQPSLANQPAFEHVRSLFDRKSTITLLVRGEGIDVPVQTMRTQWLDEIEEDPLGNWFENPRRPFLQFGMYPEAEARPKYVMKYQTSFLNFMEYVVVLGYGFIQEHESMVGERPVQGRLDHTIKLLQVPNTFGDRAFYGFIPHSESLEDMRIKEGMTATINFTENNVLDQDWTLLVVKSIPDVTPPYHTTVIVYPKWDVKTKKFQTLPETTTPLQLSGKDDDKLSLQDRLLAGSSEIEVSLRFHSSDKPFRQTLNSLWQFQRGYYRQRPECPKLPIRPLLLGNDYRPIARFDAYRNLRSLVSPQEIETIVNACTLNQQQRRAFDTLSDLVGGLGIFQGPPGTGKTYWLIAVLLPFVLASSRSIHPSDAPSKIPTTTSSLPPLPSDGPATKQPPRPAQQTSNKKQPTLKQLVNIAIRSRDLETEAEKQAKTNTANNDTEVPWLDDVYDLPISKEEESTAPKADEGNGDRRPSSLQVRPFQVLVVSAANDPLTELAHRFHSQVVKTFDEHFASSTREPIIIRLHSVTTEEKVMDHFANNDKARKEGMPPRLSTAEVDKDEFPDGIEASTTLESLIETFQQVSSGQVISNILDRRLKKVELSLAYWMLRFAGLIPSLPAMAKGALITDFRNLFHLLLDNTQEDGKDENRQLFRTKAKELRQYVLQRAQVVVCTISMAAQFSLYSTFEPAVIAVDETAQIGEPLLWNVFGRYNPDAYIFVGDHYQLRPYVESKSFIDDKEELEFRHIPENIDNGFSNQIRMSLFTRLVANGHPYVMFDTQHRMHPDIGALVSNVFYRGILKTATVGRSTKTTAITRRFIAYNQKNHHQFDILEEKRKRSRKDEGNEEDDASEEKPAAPEVKIFVSLDSSTLWLDTTTSKTEVDTVQGNSKYCVGNVHVTMTYLTNILKRRVCRGDQIAIIVPYIRQQQLYEQAIALIARANRIATAGSEYRVDDVKVYTIDSFQGGEQEVVFLDLVISKKLGFLHEPNRLNVAFSRAKAAMYVVGNLTSLAASRREGHQQSRRRSWLYEVISVYQNSHRVHTITSPITHPTLSDTEPFSRVQAHKGKDKGKGKGNNSNTSASKAMNPNEKWVPRKKTRRDLVQDVKAAKLAMSIPRVITTTATQPTWDSGDAAANTNDAAGWDTGAATANDAAGWDTGAATANGASNADGAAAWNGASNADGAAAWNGGAGSSAW